MKSCKNGAVAGAVGMSLQIRNRTITAIKHGGNPCMERDAVAYTGLEQGKTTRLKKLWVMNGVLGRFKRGRSKHKPGFVLL